MTRKKNERAERWEQPMYSALTEETLIATGWVDGSYNGDKGACEVHCFNTNYYLKFPHGYAWIPEKSLYHVFVSPQAEGGRP